MLRNFVDAIRTSDGDILMLLKLTLGHEFLLDAQFVLEHVLLAAQGFDFAVALDGIERERNRRAHSNTSRTILRSNDHSGSPSVLSLAVIYSQAGALEFLCADV